MGKRGLFEGDEIAFGVGPLILIERDQPCPVKGVEECVEYFAVGGGSVSKCAG